MLLGSKVNFVSSTQTHLREEMVKIVINRTKTRFHIGGYGPCTETRLKNHECQVSWLIDVAITEVRGKVVKYWSTLRKSWRFKHPEQRTEQRNPWRWKGWETDSKKMRSGVKTSLVVEWWYTRQLHKSGGEVLRK